MRRSSKLVSIAAFAVLLPGSLALHAGDPDQSVQLGPRPFFLVDGMSPGNLKNKLRQCKDGPFYRTDFSIGHRGAALQFPEHTKESYEAGARQGAGIVECDVTFTKDGKLVCRHSDCDLHTTTNVVAIPDLNEKCSVPWTGPPPAPAPKCCTWNFTLDEFRMLQGKMDASAPSATTAQGYLGGTASWRTDLYTSRGTLLTLKQSLKLNEKNGVGHTPELKGGDPVEIATVFQNQAGYSQAILDVLRDSEVDPRRVWLQSFDVRDILYWIDEDPEFGRQAVYLLDYDAALDDIVIQPPYDAMPRAQYFRMLKRRGVRIVAPPIPALLKVNAAGKIVPSPLAKNFGDMGFDIITWTAERSDLRQGASKAGYYYDFDPTGQAVKTDGDVFLTLDALAKDVRVLGIFSDWPATVTYYANCFGY